MIVLFMGTIIAVAWNTLTDRTFSDQELQTYCNHLDDSILDIAIIGDSWVVPKQIDLGLKAQLSHMPNLRITSYGQGGAKSKRILENLFEPQVAPNSSAEVLRGATDMVIIIAGVNDLTSHIGKDFYAYHMMKMVEQFNACSILPIIVTLPEFNIEGYFADRPLYKKLLKDIPNKLLFDDNQLNARQEYIGYLTQQLQGSTFNYLLVPFDDFITDYEMAKEQYDDWNHLNATGYQELGRFIGSYISEQQLSFNERTIATPINETKLD